MIGHKLTDKIEAADRGVDWYLLRAATRREKTAEGSLIERGFSVYVPRMASFRLDRRTHKRERVERPLFDGYLFAGLPADEVLSAFNVEGVSGPVRFSAERRPLPVSFFSIEALVRSEVGGAFDKTLENVITPLQEGEEVRVLEGPFAGFGAWVVKLSKKERVSLLVSVFGRMSSITLKTNQVERAA